MSSSHKKVMNYRARKKVEIIIGKLKWLIKDQTEDMFIRAQLHALLDEMTVMHDVILRMTKRKGEQDDARRKSSEDQIQSE